MFKDIKEKELEEKYLLLKSDDVKRFLTTEEIYKLDEISKKISNRRKEEGKKDNEYVVLNLDDKIDVRYLTTVWMCLDKLTVRRIAVDLVSATLRCKDNTR